MEIKEKKITELIEAEYNPRRLTKDQYKQLKDSLLRFGVVDPVLVNINEERKNIIIGGHQRTKVWSDLGNDTIPCVELNLTLDQEKELNVRLNKNTGEFDFDALANFFEQEDLIHWGFDEQELDLNFDEEEPEAEEDNYQEPDEVQTDIVEGDLITFEKDGKELHRLLCGDSTKKEDVERLMNGKKADLILTDPPYNGTMGEGGFKKSPKLADLKTKLKESVKDIYNFDPSNTFPIIENIKSDKCNVFLFCNKNLIPNYLNFALKKNMLFDVLTWHKPNFIPANNNTYFPDTEYLIKLKDKGAVFNTGLSEKVSYNKYWVINGKEESYLYNHPTVKPFEILKDCILICSNQKEIIIDLFLGSGSTMAASHQLKRKCYGLELMPKYCQVITDRMKALDSDLIIKINGKEYE